VVLSFEMLVTEIAISEVSLNTSDHSTVELPAEPVTIFSTKSKLQEKQWVSFN